MELNCTPRSLEQFPGDFFTLSQRQNGGVIVHILICIYIFGALAIVCDDYFVASLEYICDGEYVNRLVHSRYEIYSAQQIVA